MLVIPVVYIIIFAYIPMMGAQIAFREYNVLDGIWGSPWVGLDNLKRFFNSYQLPRVVPNTIILSLYSLVAGFPFPIILALMLNTVRSSKYKRFVQTVTYMPYFISVVVLVGMLLQFLNPRIGLYGVLYRLISGEQAPDILANPAAFRSIYVWSGIWQGTGWNAIVYIATLSAVDPELHEAAQIDGASRWQRVLHIDVPVIIPTASILLILSAGRIMSVGFEKVYLLQNNLNLRTTEVISTHVYKIGLAAGGGDFSYATAIDLFNGVINFILLIAVNKFSKKLGQSGLF